jgi:hypothetical protein
MIGSGIGRIAAFVVIESEAKNSWRGTFVERVPRGKRNYLNVLNFRVQRGKMVLQFLLFVIAVLLVSIFWELTKINKHLRTLLTQKKTDHDWAKKDAA